MVEVGRVAYGITRDGSIDGPEAAPTMIRRSCAERGVERTIAPHFDGSDGRDHYFRSREVLIKAARFGACPCGSAMRFERLLGVLFFRAMVEVARGLSRGRWSG